MLFRVLVDRFAGIEILISVVRVYKGLKDATCGVENVRRKPSVRCGTFTVMRVSCMSCGSTRYLGDKGISLNEYKGA